jgi:hypothetical protein
MTAVRPIRLGKPSVHEDPAEQGMVLVDIPLRPNADSRWMSIFATRIGSSTANAWTVTGESIRLRSPASPDALRGDLTTLRDVVRRTNADASAAGAPSTSTDVMASLRQVIDEEFDTG